MAAGPSCRLLLESFMSRRRPMSRKGSRKHFRSHAGVHHMHPRNALSSMPAHRGGIRL